MADPAADDMTRSANNLLAALNAEQKAKAVFAMKDDERLNWHFIPRERKGLPIKEMTPAQRNLAHALLSSGLSQRGYAKAATIMSLEDILREMEQGRGPKRDPELYFVSIFGEPDPKGTWGWRFEGHHLSLNFTVIDGKVISGGPSFLGSNPGEVREGPRKGLRVLAAEEDLGRELVKSLDADQRKAAIIDAAAPKEIVTGNDRKAKELTPPGLASSKLTASQLALLQRLISEHAYHCRPEMAAGDLKKIDFKRLHLAWAGSLEPGQGHYYRVQGPTFLFEYDNTQNNANHIHTVWRDLEKDFGEDLLRQHYQQVPHSK
jgi:hypothetical protein